MSNQTKRTFGARIREHIELPAPAALGWVLSVGTLAKGGYGLEAVEGGTAIYLLVVAARFMWARARKLFGPVDGVAPLEP